MPQERFYKATDKLMNAFLMGALKHGRSCECAVGQLVNGYSDWAHFHSSIESRRIEAIECLLMSPYPISQTFEIEKQFEGKKTSHFHDAYSGMSISLNRNNDWDGFIGLSRVFDYLVSIEDWKEEESKVNLIEMCLQ